MFCEFEADALPFFGLAEHAAAFADEVGVVVGFAHVGEDDAAHVFVIHLFEEVPGVLVREVAVSGADALFEVPGVRAFEKSVHIVVGFENEAVTALEAHLNELRGYPEVGAYPEPGTFVFDDKTCGFARVMGCGEGMDPEVADFEGFAGAEDGN